MITFHTANLNKRLYRNMIWNVLYHLDQLPWPFLHRWQINIYPSEAANLDFFKHYKTTDGQKINPLMASGVTGKYVIDLFLIDSDNEMISRSNSDRVQHELCHAVLFDTEYFVKGVHTNLLEGKRFKISFWYWNRFWWKKFQISIIDVIEYI